jgi:hypothetical protein
MMAGGWSRARVAVLAGLAVPLALTVVLVPFRVSFPNTDAALTLILVVVAVAANGYRLAGVLAEAGGLLQGRFLLTPGPGTRPTLEQRLVAVAFAGQASAALAGGQLAGHYR